ncbi:MAG TPA: hypothetical protein VF209_04285 [Patescibacteria group bacterium]
MTNSSKSENENKRLIPRPGSATEIEGLSQGQVLRELVKTITTFLENDTIDDKKKRVGLLLLMQTYAPELSRVVGTDETNQKTSLVVKSLEKRSSVEVPLDASIEELDDLISYILGNPHSFILELT